MTFGILINELAAAPFELSSGLLLILQIQEVSLFFRGRLINF